MRLKKLFNLCGGSKISNQEEADVDLFEERDTENFDFEGTSS